MSRGSDEARPEEIEASSAIHLPLDQLELGDLTFVLSVRPWLGQGRLHRSLIGSDALPERGQQAVADFRPPQVPGGATAAVACPCSPASSVGLSGSRRVASESEAEMMDDAFEPGCASGGTGCDAVGERLAEDPPGAAHGGTPEPPDVDTQVDGTAVRGEVGQPAIIPAMDLRRSYSTLRAGCMGRLGLATISRRSGSVVTVSTRRPAGDITWNEPRRMATLPSRAQEPYPTCTESGSEPLFHAETHFPRCGSLGNFCP